MEYRQVKIPIGAAKKLRIVAATSDKTIGEALIEAIDDLADKYAEEARANESPPPSRRKA
jgi:hypothetical protein